MGKCKKNRAPPMMAASALTIGEIERTVLGNGVRVITEAMPHVRSVAVGIWIGTGSRNEAPQENGICHFIEHMLFKGTTTRSAEDIARSVDSIGGNLDAFTAKELVSFTAKVLDEHLARPSKSWRTWCCTRYSRPEISSRKKESSWKSSRWTRTIRSTWSTRSSPVTSGRTTRWASPSWAPERPCAGSPGK